MRLKKARGDQIFRAIQQEPVKQTLCCEGAVLDLRASKVFMYKHTGNYSEVSVQMCDLLISKKGVCALSQEPSFN